MKELKTLNEIMHDWDSLAPGNQWTKTDEEEMPSKIALQIKQEAIEWAKELPKTNWHDDPDGVFKFIKRFFNLSEEDLK